MQLRGPIAAGTALALLAGIAAFVDWSAPEPQVLAQTASPTQRPAARVPAPTARAQPAASAAAPVARGDVAAALRADFEQAGDYRAFAMAALDRPAEGGLLYARHAVLACLNGDRGVVNRGVKTSVDQHGTVDPAQIAAGERLLARCASFFPGEHARLIGEMKARAQRAADPLLQAEQAGAEAERDGRPEVLRAAAARILAIGDPLLLSSHGALFRLTMADAEAKKEGGLWVDHKLVRPDDGNETLLWSAALSLGMCADTGPCGSDELVEAACILNGICKAGREAYFRWFFEEGGLGQGEIDTIFARTDRVRRAVREQDVGFFVR